MSRTQFALLTSKSAMAIVLAFVVAIPLHAYGHEIAAHVLGYQTTSSGTYTVFSSALPANGIGYVVSMAGGIFAGLILGPVGVLLRGPYSYSFLVLAIAQAFYAPFDILSDGGFLYARKLAGVLVLMGVELLRASGVPRRPRPIRVGRARLRA